MATIEIIETAFSPYEKLANYLPNCRATEFGATSIFIGTMRDFNDGENVERMFLEHYPAMTQKQLTKIANEAMSRWPILDTLIIHRVGDLHPHETIVLIAVWSAHRGAAFEACRFLIEELKHCAPFWKREIRRDGSTHWVTHNTAG